MKNRFIALASCFIMLMGLSACGENIERESPSPSPVRGDTAPAEGLDPTNLALKFAPSANLQLVFVVNGEDGPYEKKYQTVRLNGMSTEYLCTSYALDSSGEYFHYYAEPDGLGVISNESDHSVIVVPNGLTLDTTWEQYRLMRVEEGNPEYTGGEGINCAYILEMGLESDYTYVYGESLGLVSKWDNASCSGVPQSYIKEVFTITAQEAHDGFESIH